MEKGNVWNKIRTSVVDGVTIAVEKTEEYTRLGKAKIDVLAVRRKIVRKQADLGALIYQAVKEGRTGMVMDSDPVRDIIVELELLDNELSENERVYNELRAKAESDVAAVREKAMSEVSEIKSKAKAKVERIKRKTGGSESAEEPEKH
jgi:hypothetical protein